MANVAHSTLTGADLHEPKGIGTAAASTVYIADGVGSGAWSGGGTLLGITGQISDFATPLPPTGWLECDGSTPLRASFLALFNAVTIQQSGTRTSGSAIITGLTSTTNMRAGYFVGGTGITNGSTILIVDSATQITISTNAGSSGTATVIIGPWGLGDGTTTFTLPNALNRFRRARSATSGRVGVIQAADTLVPNHQHSGTTDSGGASHSHGGNTGTTSNSHTHDTGGIGTSIGLTSSGAPNTPVNIAAITGVTLLTSTITSSTTSADHTHTIAPDSALHTHTFTSSAGQGGSGTETRPINFSVLTCIKT